MRPEHLHCINTVEGIHRINEAQRIYDEDPEKWEQQEREHEEQIRMEQEEMAHQESLDYEKYVEQKQAEEQQDDSLPF